MAAPASAQGLWTEVLARLSLAAVACDGPEARRQLHVLGVRRTGTAALLLARELAMARRMASASGCLPRPLDLHHRVGQLARPADLDWHLQGLAAAYQQLLQHQDTWPQGPVCRWLEARCRVHAAQAESLAPRH
ncbi:MAG: hypothetical protein KBC73_24455 [Burkholderiaceae bacterium]|nr:hypothetical protein [Burkholderiaceae bacterium]